MAFVCPAKYLELESAVVSRSFPIIVYGPSSSGKTHTINAVLAKLGLRPVFVDLSTTKTKKPLDKKAVVLVYLYSIASLERIVYRESVIIESNIQYLNKLEGYKLIKFNSVTPRRMEGMGYPGFNGNLFSVFFNIMQPDYSLGLYRFIGRIFYKKITARNIELDGCYLYAEVDSGRDEQAGLMRHGDRRWTQRSTIENSSDLKIECLPEKRGTKKLLISESSSSEDGMKARGCRRISIVDSSSGEENNSLEEIDGTKIFSSSEDADSESRHEVDADDLETSVPTVSFEAKKILGYLHENVVDFCDVESLSLFYDCISLCDINELHLLTLIQCVAQKGKAKHGKTVFRSGNIGITSFINTQEF